MVVARLERGWAAAQERVRVGEAVGMQRAEKAAEVAEDTVVVGGGLIGGQHAGGPSPRAPMISQAAASRWTAIQVEAP